MRATGLNYRVKRLGVFGIFPPIVPSEIRNDGNEKTAELTGAVTVDV
jgi:hypothetical protein